MAVVQHIVEKTDGVPLYVEEMTKAILESGMLREVSGQYALEGSFASLTIPTTLDYLRIQSNDGIVRSLLADGPERVKIRSDGLVLQGHHCIKVLAVSVRG